MANSYNIPETSVTLLADLGRSNETPRWTTFYNRYKPGMEAFLRHTWPKADADEIVQEAFCRLIRILPGYHYTEGQEKRFHNYLLAIVNREAHKWYDRNKRYNDRNVHLGMDGECAVVKEEDGGWKALSCEPEQFCLEAADILRMKEDLGVEATQQVLKDESIPERSREIFRLIALKHERPEAVAERFEIKRAYVDRLKHDVMVRVRRRWRDLLAAVGLDE